ncbi:MAG: GNAT family protein [Planctomycetota bacterium]
MNPLEEKPPFEIDAHTGLPIGPLVSTSAATFPSATTLRGERIHLSPLSPEHDEDLFQASCGEGALASYRYLLDSMPESVEDMRLWREDSDKQGTRVGFALIDAKTNRAQGSFFLMRIRAQMRSLEVGNIRFGPTLKRTAAATEAIYLLMRHVFDDLGYRRFEWKCDALNAPSRKAALRFGFQFEGIFRRDLILNGRTRDTAWYSILDEEWPQLQKSYQAWLQASNFDSNDEQITRLGEGHIVIQ